MEKDIVTQPELEATLGAYNAHLMFAHQIRDRIINGATVERGRLAAKYNPAHGQDENGNEHASLLSGFSVDGLDLAREAIIAHAPTRRKRTAG